MPHAIVQHNFFDLTFTLVNYNSFIFVHILVTSIAPILYNFKGYLRKSEQITGTSSNISEFDRPTILSNEDESKEYGCKI